MIRHYSACALFAAAALAVTTGCSAEGSTGPITDTSHPGFRYYQQYCMGCHGPSMEGAGASSLRDGEWQFGGSREEIYSSIADGIEDYGMPGYGAALDRSQIELIVDAIQGIEYEPPGTPAAEAARDTLRTLDYVVGVERWVGGLSTPWAIRFLDRERALITERPGPVRLVVNGELHPDPIEGTPEVVAQGQGGMMEVAIDPDFEENGWIYLAYSHPHPEDSRRAMTRIVRGRIDDHKWTDQEVVYQAPLESYTTARQHYGVRIVFCDEGYLYFAIGDRGRPANAQDLGNPAGKAHRIRRDGSVPQDNPFVDVEGALPTIWSYGLRNPQGLDFHPVTGQLWEAEHGPRGGDEINILRPGLNYGWPEVTHGINYNGSIITLERERPGMEQPIWYWRPSTALCAIEFYRGDEFPLWRNKLIATALRNEDVRLMEVHQERIIHEEVILEGRGRVRDVLTGPDGAIYLVMNSPDEVLRLTAVEQSIQ